MIPFPVSALTSGDLRAIQYAAGQGNDGEGGLGVVASTIIPTAANSTLWSKIAAGDACSILMRDGRIYSCGLNGNGRTGQGTATGSTTSITQIGSTTGWTHISSSISLNSAWGAGIRAGQLYTWGSNSSYRTGLNTNSGSTLAPTVASASTGWSTVACGYGNGYAIKDGGKLYAWGEYEADGFITTLGFDTQTPTQIISPSHTDWTHVSGGESFGLAIRSGQLYSWGNGSNGRTGQGGTGNLAIPTQVGALSTWRTCDAGGNFGLAIKTDGTLWSWGSNTNGRTGQNTASGNTLSPTQVGVATNWAHITAGTDFAMAINTLGELWSWGSNLSGRTAQNTATGDTLVPTKVGVITNWRAVSAGTAHSLILRQ